MCPEVIKRLRLSIHRALHAGRTGLSLVEAVDELAQHLAVGAVVAAIDETAIPRSVQLPLHRLHHTLRVVYIAADHGETERELSVGLPPEAFRLEVTCPVLAGEELARRPKKYVKGHFQTDLPFQQGQSPQTLLVVVKGHA